MRLDILVGSFIEGKRPSVLSISVRVATAEEMPHFLFLKFLPPGESCAFILRLISHLKRTERVCLSLVIVSVSEFPIKRGNCDYFTHELVGLYYYARHNIR